MMGGIRRIFGEGRTVGACEEVQIEFKEGEEKCEEAYLSLAMRPAKVSTGLRVSLKTICESYIFQKISWEKTYVPSATKVVIPYRPDSLEIRSPTWGIPFVPPHDKTVSMLLKIIS